MSYKKEFVSHYLINGHKKKVVEIVAKNGKAIAECNTEAMADKIIRGLDLVERADREARDWPRNPAYKF